MNLYRRIRRLLHPLRAAYVRRRALNYQARVRREFESRSVDGFLTVIAEEISVRLKAEGAVARDIALDGHYEPEVGRAILSLMGPGRVFLDIGANAGYFSLLAARKGAKVHAFEPTPSTFRLLRENIEANGLGGIAAQNLAVMDRCGVFTLFLNREGSEELNTLAAGNISHGEIIGSVDVTATTIDDYVRVNGLEQVDVIKVDTEGAELPVIKGACETLRRFGPCLFFESGREDAFDYSASDLIAFLSSVGYTVEKIPNSSNMLIARS